MAYTAPAITEVGSIESITLGSWHFEWDLDDIQWWRMFKEGPFDPDQGS
jgi:hypothetical protein